MLSLIKMAIFTYAESIFIKVIRNKSIKDDYRSILSETEHRSSNNIAAENKNMFVITLCELQPSEMRKSKYWVMDVRIPDNTVFSGIDLVD